MPYVEGEKPARAARPREAAADRRAVRDRRGRRQARSTTRTGTTSSTVTSSPRTSCCRRAAGRGRLRHRARDPGVRAVAADGTGTQPRHALLHEPRAGHGGPGSESGKRRLLPSPACSTRCSPANRRSPAPPRRLCSDASLRLTCTAEDAPEVDSRRHLCRCRAISREGARGPVPIAAISPRHSRIRRECQARPPGNERGARSLVPWGLSRMRWPRFSSSSARAGLRFDRAGSGDTGGAGDVGRSGHLERGSRHLGGWSSNRAGGSRRRRRRDPDARPLLVPVHGGAEHRGAELPFLSPDGSQLAFRGGGAMRQVSLEGGPTTVLDADAAWATEYWSRRQLYYARSYVSGLWRNADGAPEMLTEPAARSSHTGIPSCCRTEAHLFTAFRTPIDSASIAVFVSARASGVRCCVAPCTGGTCRPGTCCTPARTLFTRSASISRR